MDIERGNLEIIFQKIPYTKINMCQMNPHVKHDYKTINKSLYMQYSQNTFSNASEDERYNNYLLLLQDMKENKTYEPNIFQLIMNMSEKLLTYDGIEVKCKFNEILRWREISFQLGQDFFTCSFLAKYDLERGEESQFFAWLPIIRSDNDRLHNILKRGIAENHFHLAGSTKVFELNWLCLMNLIDGRVHDFKKVDRAMQSFYLDRIQDRERGESFYVACQHAALYRVYLFSVLKNNLYLMEIAEDILNKIENGYSIEENVAEIQDTIVLAKSIYGARVDGENILDYALQTDMIGCNNNECRLLAGERRFLYECYKAALTEQFNYRQKNLFYIYLSIRTYFRGELIQINHQVGFANFKRYQDRKEFFIEGEKAYENELIRLAVNEVIRKENVNSLEARICPKSKSSELYKVIKCNEEIAKTVEDKEAYHKLIYVLHFLKSPENGFCAGAPRNDNVRRMAKQQMRGIVALLEKGLSVNRCIKGIDACSSEIGCRPETFAQIFRYLADFRFHYYEKKDEIIKMQPKGGWLHTTYHVGEDFLDIIDGIRAVDEAILFCGLSRGSRIGHGLALGINPDEYYKYKGYRLSLPKQLLLDDIVWIICKADKTGCVIDKSLKAELENRYYSLYEELYHENVTGRFQASVLEYYQSWKLRGDNPEVYRLDECEFLKKLEKTELQKIDRYEFNNRVNNNIRKTRKSRDLYFAYQYNKKVREKGEERTEFKVDSRYSDIVRQLQDKMIRQLIYQGIGIETNPSSNYLIGTINKYDEHPILRFNSRKLVDAQTNMSLNVSINTDDQGVFDTLLENEYALMALALQKAQKENHQPMYEIENIYEWLDYVRQMGLEQVFT